MAPKPGMMADLKMGAGSGVGSGPGPAGLGPGPGKEKASFGKVKDLLQQAMDMLAELETGDQSEDNGLPARPPGLEPRPPLRTMPGM